MKVLFLVGNFYLHAEPFSRIAEILHDWGIDSNLYYIGDENIVMGRDTCADENHPDIRNVEIFRIKTSTSIYFNALQFLKVLINRARIGSFLRKEKPFVLVTGGDITNINTRLFLDLAAESSIKTVLVPIVMPGSSVVNPSSNKNIPLARFARYMLHFVKLERTIFFRGWVLGSYQWAALIAAPNEDARQLLIENGIAGERVIVTGNPRDDKIYDLRSREIENKSDVQALLDCPENSLLIAYCTEVIQDVHGIEYLNKINDRLFDLFSSLPARCHIVIKLHPREPAHIEEDYRHKFMGERFHVVRNDVDILGLLRAARLVICHFSAVLIDAALLGATVLSIRIIARDGIPIRFDALNPFIHIESYDEIEQKCRAAIFESSFIDGQEKVIDQWMEKAGFRIDGRNAHHIAELIAGQIHARGNAS
jgi:hypothetical protein